MTYRDLSHPQWVFEKKKECLGDLLHNIQGWSVQKTVKTMTMNCLSCLLSELSKHVPEGGALMKHSKRGRGTLGGVGGEPWVVG